jgi:glycolate oxidase FAD binding subunit
MILRPATPEEVGAAVRAHPRVWVRGGGSKPALSAVPPDGVLLELTGLAGMQEYDPAEFTFTALAGTRVAEVEATLAAHGQYMPFDPPFARQGATLGGTVAAGLSGPGRFRYGGVRDFVIGVQFVDGGGALARAGGRVVKNAAGFDLPKAMAGSLGRLGVLVSLSFKVFPRPEAYATLRIEYAGLPDALGALVHLSTSPFDLEALDLEPPARLLLRLGGTAAVLSRRLDRVRAAAGGRAERLADPEELRLWEEARAFQWAGPSSTLVKVPVTPKRIPDLEGAFARDGIARRYGAGGNAAWIAGDDILAAGLDETLRAQGLAGLVLRGPTDRVVLGAVAGAPFARRVKRALDPADRFPAFPGETLRPASAGAAGPSAGVG